MNESFSILDRIFSNTSLGHRLLERLDVTNLRHAFYLISPYETAVESVEEVPNYGIQVSTWWFVFILSELTLLFISGHSDRFALNDSITSISAGMLSQCFKFGGRAVAIFLYVFIWENARLLTLPWDSPWTWILCLFFQDFMYYLGHRAVHEMGFLWGLHTIHHSSEYFNYSTALRQAALQDAALALYDVLQAFFIPPSIFLVHRYFSEIFQFLMHTSLFGDFGPLGFVFNTPSHHRVHHGRNPYCIDKNFGGVFIIWDRMFGTFEAERKSDPPIYGLIHNENHFNQLWLQFHALLYIAFCKGREKDEKGEDKFPGVVNKPSQPVVKYDPPLCGPLKVYVLVHFLLLLSIFFHFEYDRAHLTYGDFVCKLLFFVLSMQVFGAFFDGRWWGPVAEIVRCVSVILYVLWSMRDSHGVAPNRVSLLSTFSLSAVIMLLLSLYRFFKRDNVVPQEKKKETVMTMEKRGAA